jgi:uncharacterized membrane protein
MGMKMKITNETKNAFTTLLIGLVVAVVLPVLLHLIGYLLPTALIHLAPKMSLNLGELEMFEPMLRGALIILIGFVTYIILPFCVIGLVASSLYKLGELGKWMFKKI